jgi:hypothetical protein
MSRLVIAVPKGRGFCGRAILVGSNGATRAGPFRALATASVRVATKHANPAASPLMLFGHPPEGVYVVAASLPPGYAHRRRSRRYGRVGALLLAPQSGDALRAAENGRTLIAIHGGPRDTKRRLRPTRGGIRFSNQDMVALLSAMNDAQRDADPLTVVELAEIEKELAGKADKKGKRRLERPSNDTMTVTPMALLPFALGGAGKAKVARRELLVAAAVAFGALAIQACDRPSTLACFPEDADVGDGGRHLAFDAGKKRLAYDGGCPSGYVEGVVGGVG